MSFDKSIGNTLGSQYLSNLSNVPKKTESD